jgi:hypothetical protein
MRPRAASTDDKGLEDGFAPELSYSGEMDPRGGTRIVVSVPADQLPTVHQRLLAVLRPPLGVLWRQVVDRRAPRPQGTPPRDHVGLDLGFERLLAAIRASSGVVYEDARAEVWVRGALGEQLILDQDGLIYCYPDDPSWRDALEGLGVPDRESPTLAGRDYVKHWFHAEHDAEEDQLVKGLGLTHVPPRR